MRGEIEGIALDLDRVQVGISRWPATTPPIWTAFSVAVKLDPE